MTHYGDLVFTFPTRVNLTTITLHYYSDNIRGFGFPCLEFTALREYIVSGGSVYEGTTIEAPRPVSPDGESTGPKSSYQCQSCQPYYKIYKDVDSQV